MLKVRFVEPLVVVLLLSLSSYGHTCEEIRAAFDVGSGTTKMKVYEYNFCNNKIIKQVEERDGFSCEANRKVSYKEDFKESNSIQKETVDSGIKAILNLKEIAIHCGAQKFSGVATSAFRQAENGKKSVERLENETGVSISIISQKEEAILGFNGAMSKVKTGSDDNVCVWDIGGSSMQIVCSSNDTEKVYLGNLASVPFKDYFIKNKKVEFNKTLTTPNPISPNEYSRSREQTDQEAVKIKKVLGKSLEEGLVFGIGGVHYYAVSKKVGKKEFSSDDISNDISNKLDMSDEQLGGGKYVDSSLSNLILVEGLMRSLKISTVNALKVNLTEGLVTSSKYWD